MDAAPTTPGYIEVTASYSKHLGARFEAAGVTLQFHYNQTPGIHFKVEPPAEYQNAILKGIEDGMASRFPKFPSDGSIWITEIIEHPIDSCEIAFYRAARAAIEQAYFIRTLTYPGPTT